MVTDLGSKPRSADQQASDVVRQPSWEGCAGAISSGSLGWGTGDVEPTVSQRIT